MAKATIDIGVMAAGLEETITALLEEGSIERARVSLPDDTMLKVRGAYLVWAKDTPPMLTILAGDPVEDEG